MAAAVDANLRQGDADNLVHDGRRSAPGPVRSGDIDRQDLRRELARRRCCIRYRSARCVLRFQHPYHAALWFDYRNDGLDEDLLIPPPTINGRSRVAYLDLSTGELVTFDLGTLDISGSHNIQVDDQGTVWITAENSGVIVEIDFDRLAMERELRRSIRSKDVW